MLSGNKGMVSSRSVLLLLACLAVLGLSSSFCSADLSPADDTALTGYLETLTYTWDVGALGGAEAIFTNPGYTSTDFQTFFNKYFNTQAHVLTDMLWSYLYYEAFSPVWTDEATHLKLQTAMITPFWTRITNFTAAHSSDLGTALYNDPLMVPTMHNCNKFYACAEADTHISGATRTTIFNNYASYITSYPQYWSDATTLDVNAQPFVGQLRAQVWISFADAPSPLTSGDKTTIKDTIDLTAGEKTTLWDNYTILAIDNNGYSAAQTQAIIDLAAAIPASMTDLRYVTCRDFFHGTGGGGPVFNKSGNYRLYSIKGGGVFDFSFGNAQGSGQMWNNHGLTAGQWNHVAATWDGTTNPDSMKVYVNGVLDATHQATATPQYPGPADLNLGVEGGFNDWYKGRMDEVKIYARCLSGTEVTAEYNLQPVSTANLVGHWRMDETGGTTVADSSTYGNSGTNNNAAIIPGKVNNALSWNGSSSYVNVPNSASLNLGGAFTLEAWLYVVNEDVYWPTTGASHCINTFGCDVGQYQENQFPNDIAACYDDLFASCVLHEMNHIVDAYTVWNDPTFDAREAALISQAGPTVDLQYLRSQIGAAFFTANPGEFFASISNQYVCSTQHTLDLALQRFDGGYDEPINQFLFFADVYSQGTTTTKFFTVDTSAVVTVNNATLGRNGNGHITSLTYGGTTYNFTVDASGNVLSYSTGGAGGAPTYVGAGAVDSTNGQITPTLPSGLATNDILLLFVETANQAVSISSQNGGTWTQVVGSPQGTGTAGGSAATRLTAFWSRYNGTQGAPTTTDSGNHTIGRIIAIRGAATSGNPWDVTGGGVEATSDTSGSIPGVTTTVANTLVVTAIATALPDATGTTNFSAWTNANLGSLTERTDDVRPAGNGGGLGIATGVKATAGATGNTAVTCGASATKGMMTIAIKQ